MSKTPTLSNGGFWIAPISPARSSAWPLFQAASTIADSRMCSRLLSGSAAMPTSPSSPATVAEIRSRVAAGSAAAAGGANERSTDRDRPAVLPGV